MVKAQNAYGDCEAQWFGLEIQGVGGDGRERIKGGLELLHSYLKGENSIKMLWRRQRMALVGIYGFPVVS